MNGAIAELCARINRIANRPSVMRIGVIHQRLLLQKKANNSPAIPKRWPVVFKKPIEIPFLSEDELCARSYEVVCHKLRRLSVMQLACGPQRVLGLPICGIRARRWYFPLDHRNGGKISADGLGDQHVPRGVVVYVSEDEVFQIPAAGLHPGTLLFGR